MSYSLNRVGNVSIYDNNWPNWLDMKIYGPASRWLRYLIFICLNEVSSDEISSILDVGCGEGCTTFLLAKRFCNSRVDGIDFSQAGIHHAKERWYSPNLYFYYDKTSDRLNESYDLVCCFEVLEHVENWKAILKRIIDTSNKYIALSFPTGRMRDFEKSVGHIRNFKIGDVESYLSEHAFTSVKCLYAGFPFYSPIYRELCAILDAGKNRLTRGKFGTGQKVASSILFCFFKFFSTKHKYGDQFCGLFKKNIGQSNG